MAGLSQRGSLRFNSAVIRGLAYKMHPIVGSKLCPEGVQSHLECWQLLTGAIYISLSHLEAE